jgi:hypothetical protein
MLNYDHYYFLLVSYFFPPFPKTRKKITPKKRQKTKAETAERAPALLISGLVFNSHFHTYIRTYWGCCICLI